MTPNQTRAVVVIQIVSGTVSTVYTFSETEEGNKEAECAFRELCLERGCEDVEAALDDGSFCLDGYECVISHS